MARPTTVDRTRGTRASTWAGTSTAGTAIGTTRVTGTTTKNDVIVRPGVVMASPPPWRSVPCAGHAMRGREPRTHRHGSIGASHETRREAGRPVRGARARAARCHGGRDGGEGRRRGRGIGEDGRAHDPGWGPHVRGDDPGLLYRRRAGRAGDVARKRRPHEGERARRGTPRCRRSQALNLPNA